MDTPEQKPTINGRYTLLNKVGEGGMAEVWRAQDTVLGRIVALKILRPQYSNDPEFLTRFQQEARAAANLSHSHIVNVFDIGQAGDQHYIVMEFVDGRNLKEIIRARAPLPVNQALELAIQTATGVAHAHAAGIVHRDLKPQNILVDRNGHVKVTDFGIARAMATTSMTATGIVLGTAHYLAPEQAAGQTTTPATDVYALGVVLYEMLTGQPPFDADNSVTLALKHLQEPPPPIQQRNPRVPTTLAAIVQRALAKDPAERYANAGQLADALRAVRSWGEQHTTAQPATRAPSSAPASEVESGIDLKGIFLGFVALVAVLGLIPLWQTVYQTYVGPLPISIPFFDNLAEPIQAWVAGPTAVPTQPVITQTEIPSVVGLPKSTAIEQLQSAGLQVQIQGTSPHEEIPVDHVIQTNPPAGTLVTSDTPVRLIVSSGPPAIEVPQVVGQPADQAAQRLRKAGFEVQQAQSWHGQVPAGVVIAQAPPGGARITQGSPVLLTVSTGPIIPVNANLANQIDLVEAELPTRTLQPGDLLQLTLRWRAREPILPNYVVFLHIVRPDGTFLTQFDSQPVNGGFPTSLWIPGQFVSDTYRIPIPSDAPAGTYEIRVGMYPPGQPGLDQRLPIFEAGDHEIVDNSVVITKIEIQ